MRYEVGHQEAFLISNVVDSAGDPVTGESLTGFMIAPDGTSTALTSTNPSSNNYRVLGPTFTMPGRWHGWVKGTTPGQAYAWVWEVNYSPAAV